jgi:hypothetical protein
VSTDQVKLAGVAQDDVLIAANDHMKASPPHLAFQRLGGCESSHGGDLPADNTSITNGLRLEYLLHPPMRC